MSANSKPWKLHKLCFLLQMLIPPHPNTSVLSWSPSSASFLGRFSSSHHTEGEQPTGNVRAKLAPPPPRSPTSLWRLWGLPGWPVFCGADSWAGLPAGGTVVPLSSVWGAGSRLCIQLSCDWITPRASFLPSTVSALCLPGADTRTARIPDAGPVLADTLRKFLFDLDVDDGLAAIGYSKADIPALVKGTLPQVRDAAHPHCLLRSTRLQGRHGPFGAS